jgi:tetratricopeptide (TPR) repeat protein
MGMIDDVRGYPVTAATPEAVQRLDHSVEGYLGFRADTGDRLKEALASDPEMPLAHCLRGYFMLLFGQRAYVPRAVKSLGAARAAAAAAGITPREAQHVAALRAWCAGNLAGAVACWETILLDHPRDILALKLAQYGTFYLGDSEELRDSVARVMHAWDDGVPGVGFVFGCYAFGLEESGDYAAAERFGRRAVALNPADIWAAHAVAHVMEMQGRPRDGIAWVTEHAGQWGACNNFAFHVLWHRCLFHMALGQHETVLALYDREVRAESTDDLLDISNAVALLWRLEQAGIAVGNRWAELAERSLNHVDDHLLVFGDLHCLMALAAGPDADAAGRMIDSMRRYACRSDETEAAVMAGPGLALAEAILAHRQGDFTRAVDRLLPARRAIRRVGGSHAQRDLFDELLIDAALRADRAVLARALLSERLGQRPRDGWGWRHFAQALTALGDAAGASAAAGKAEQLLAAA